MPDLSVTTAPGQSRAAPILLAYNPALDGIRAVAIALVLLFHARVPGFHAGFVGVDVFFVLSGFLITSLLLQELARAGTINWRRFVLRRIFRLGPALAALCGAMLVMSVWVWPSTVNPWIEVAITLSYLSDVTVAFLDLPKVLGHSWSLSVEEHFYLVWPVVLLAIARGGLRWLLGSIYLLYILATVWRIELVQSGLDWRMIYFRLDARLSGLMFGALLAAGLFAGAASRQAWRRVPFWLVAVPAALMVIVVGDWRERWMLVLGTPAIEAATAAVILSCLAGSGPVYAILSTRLLRWLGKLSYSLYLWHYPIFRVLRDEFDWWVTLAIGLPLSLACAWLSYVTVERWGLTLRDRIFARKGTDDTG